MRPKSIIWFEVLAWISVAVGSLALLAAIVMSADYLDDLPVAALLLGLGLPIAILIGMAVLIVLIARRRNDVARWIYVGLVGLTLLVALVSGGRSELEEGLWALAHWLQYLLLIATAILLLLPDTQAWLGHGQVRMPYGGDRGGYAPAPGYPPQHGSPAGTHQPPYAPPPLATAPSGYAGAEAYAQPAPPPIPPAPVAFEAPPQSGSRACPFCAEEIKAAAIKCRHCGSAVEPLTA